MQSNHVVFTSKCHPMLNRRRSLCAQKGCLNQRSPVAYPCTASIQEALHQIKKEKLSTKFTVIYYVILQLITCLSREKRVSDVWV